MSDSTLEPEYLDDANTDNRKRLLAVGAVVAAAGVIGAGAWAATSFFATGAQPAEALPASTVAYASLDLDPSGGQKIEAIQTLRKFPAFNDELDLDTDDDLRETVFNEFFGADVCERVDYDDDIEPWLGSRAAVAAVDSGGEDPAVVVVAQVSDSAKAEKGIAALIEGCGGDAEDASSTVGTWIVSGDWVVAAETREVAQQVVDDAAEKSLADDAEFQRWTGAAGDAGILSFYAAKAAAEYFDDVADLGKEFTGLGGPDELGADIDSAEVTDAIKDFEGMAVTVRFSDGALEMETATSINKDQQDLVASSVGAELVASLPEDTVAAFGVGVNEGWVEQVAEQIVASEGGDLTLEDFYQEGSDATGLDLPGDVEKLLGEGVAVALGSGIDAEAFVNGGVLDLPLGVKIKGDVEDIEGVLAKLEPQLGPEDAALLESASADGYVAIGPDADFRAALVEDGSLGDTDIYQDLTSGVGDAHAVFFVNFNADNDWLKRVAEGIDEEFAENVEPLAAFGMATRFDDDVVHHVVRITTD